MVGSAILIATIVVFIFYAALIILAIICWIKPLKNSSKNSAVRLSVLIPFRNEAENLPALLKDLDDQSLPKDRWECIFVDDDSEDNGAEIIKLYDSTNFKLISSKGKGKKAALFEGFSHASFEYIVQTDADCRFKTGWLESIQSAIGGKNSFITGPVSILNPNNLLASFQTFDLMALMGMTRAGISSGWWYMANGANMAYSRHLYPESIDQGNHFASGDDMFLAEYASQRNFAMIFNASQESIVTTMPCADIKSLLNQRLRWASKNRALQSVGLKMALVISILSNALLIVLPLIDWHYLLLWPFKFIVDYRYLKRLSPFFQIPIKPRPFLICAFIYPFFICLIAVLSIFKKKYEWKNRLVK